MAKQTRKTYLTVQGPVTRNASIRTRLSNLAWSWGVAAFPLYDVPFAHSTGQLLANRMARFMSKMSADNTQETLHIYEFGVGLGMLSKHLLDHLKTTDQTLYDRATLHLSDYSEAGLKQLEDKNLFPDHTNAISYDVIDFNQPQFKSGANPSIIYFSYLMDSLDQRHIECVDGVLYELKVVTRIADDATLFDTTQFPPQLLTAKGIQELLNKNEDRTLKILSPQLVKCLKETIRRVPIEWSSLSKEEHQTLKALEASAPKKGVCRFNVPIHGIGALRTLLETLEEEGTLLFQDFGFVESYETYPRRLLTTQYRSIICHAQYFPLFEHLAKETGTQFEITKNPSGHTQILGFYKGKNAERFTSTFHDCFPDIGDEHTKTILKRLRRYEKRPGPRLSTVEKWLSDLGPYQDKCYFLLVSIARFYMDKGDFEPALHFLELSLETYEPVAVSTYLMYGKIFRAMGLLEESESVLKKALKLAPNFSPALSELSLVYLNQNNFDAYLQTMREFTCYLGEIKVWNQWIMMVLVHLEKKDTGQATTLLRWLADVEARKPGLIPSEILTKSDEIKTTFKLDY